MFNLQDFCGTILNAVYSVIKMFDQKFLVLGHVSRLIIEVAASTHAVVNKI